MNNKLPLKLAFHIRPLVPYIGAVLLLFFSILLMREISTRSKLDRQRFEDIVENKLRADAHLFDHYFEQNQVWLDNLRDSLPINSVNYINLDTLKVCFIQAIHKFQVREMNVEGVSLILYHKKRNTEYIYNNKLGTISLRKFKNDSSAFISQRVNSAYFDSCLNNRVISFSAPFGQKGMLLLYISTKEVYHLLKEQLGAYGFPYILDSSANMVVHPLDQALSMDSIGRASDDKFLIALGTRIRAGKRVNNIGEFVHKNTVTNTLCQELTYPLKKSNWCIGISSYNGKSLETSEYRNFVRRTNIRIILYSAGILLLVISFLKNRYSNLFNTPIYSILWSLILLTIIVSVIMSYYMDPFTLDHNEKKELRDTNTFSEKWDKSRLVDSQSLKRYMDINYLQANDKDQPDTAFFIPTGLYIHNVRFINSNELRIIGMIWQKITDLKKCDSKGIEFPGAIINKLELRDSILTTNKGKPEIVYRWNFDININEHLSFKLFPFGKNDISLRLWSADLDGNTVLIPDMDAYNQLYPDVCPGLGNNVSIEGWRVLDSYFAYKKNSYLCNFGDNSFIGQNEFPDLIYRIGTSRRFIDSLICRIIPLFVVLALLHTILFVRKESDSFNIVIGCASLFFVLVFEHINLRQDYRSENIMYIEYCYFYSYFMLLVITITSFYIKKDSAMHEYYAIIDKFLKQHFWSIILVLMAITTVSMFY